jgi:hypothetical protein
MLHPLRIQDLVRGDVPAGIVGARIGFGRGMRARPPEDDDDEEDD